MKENKYMYRVTKDGVQELEILNLSKNKILYRESYGLPPRSELRKTKGVKWFQNFDEAERHWCELVKEKRIP